MQSDMEVLFRRVNNASSWDSLIEWFEEQGDRDNELTPGEVIAMKEDLGRLEQQGAQFTNDPKRASDMALKHRG